MMVAELSEVFAERNRQKMAEAEAGAKGREGKGKKKGGDDPSPPYSDRDESSRSTAQAAAVVGAGIGATKAMRRVLAAAVMAAVAPTHADAGARGGRGHKKAGDDGNGLLRGNGSDYLAARIARDAPEVHERMKAGEIIVMADRRRAELEGEERKGKGRPRSNTGVALPKSQTVAESRRAPLLALPEEDQDRYFAKCREATARSRKLAGYRPNSHAWLDHRCQNLAPRSHALARTASSTSRGRPSRSRLRSRKRGCEWGLTSNAVVYTLNVLHNVPTEALRCRKRWHERRRSTCGLPPKRCRRSRWLPVTTGYPSHRCFACS
jgi:hypothetical protein